MSDLFNNVRQRLSSLVAGFKGGAGGQGDDEPDPLIEKAGAKFRELWPDLKNANIISHANIWQSFLMYVGKCWLEPIAKTSLFTLQVPSDDFTPMPNVNRFSPTIDSIAANFNTLPEVEAVPASQVSDDLKAHGISEIATALCQHAIKDNALRSDYKGDEDKAGTASQQFVLSGGTFTIVETMKEKIGSRPVTESQPGYGLQCRQCDQFSTVPKESVPEIEVNPPTCPTCNQPLEVSEASMQAPVMDEESGEPKTEDITKLKVSCRIGNLLYAVPRPGSTGMSSTPYLIWAERMMLEEIKRRDKNQWSNYYQTNKTEPNADQVFQDGFTLSYENELNYYYTGYASSTLQAKDSAMVIQIYIEPGRMEDFPDGLYAVQIGEKCIHANVWDFIEHPLTMGKYLSVPTLFHPRTPAFDLLEVCKELNRYESLITLHAMTSATDVFVQEKDAIVSEVTGRCDVVITVDSSRLPPGGQPALQRMPAGSLDEGVYAQRQELKQELENISGAVSVFRGRQPGSITAGKAIDKLSAQAEAMFGKPVTNWNNMWKETVRKLVKNYQKKYTFAELAAIIGPDRETQIQDFIDADLDTVLEFVATMQGLPRTREQKREEMMQLYDQKVLDVTDPNVQQKLFELFGETGIGQEFNEDATRARWENTQMKNGQAVKFRPQMENLMVHAGIHKEAGKVLDYEKWTPESQQLLEQHLGITLQAMMPPVAAGPAGPPNNSVAGMTAPTGPGPLGPLTAPPSAAAPLG